MKNLFTLMLLAATIVSCERNRNSDSFCPRDFEVANSTDFAIVYTDISSGETLTIAPGEAEVIFDRTLICSQGKDYSDLFLSDESVVVSPQKHILSIGGESLSEDVWLRRHWKFSAQGDRFPTYTLIVTNESVGNLLGQGNDKSPQTRASAAYRVNPNNPYSLSVVQRALNTAIGANAPTLEATHHYIRVLPQDTVELKVLVSDLNLDLFPYPLDYELTETEIQTHENTLINGFAWQYCLVSPTFQVPSGITYEFLDYAYLQDDEPGATRVPGEQLDHDVYSTVIDKAFELTGNADPQTRASAWQPSATIRYNSGVSGEAIMPLKNVLVRANTFFNSGQGYTDANGNVTIKKGWGGKFRKTTQYVIIWMKDGQWKIHDLAGKAKSHGPKQKSHWTFTIQGDGSSHNVVCATIHRALDIYYNGTYSKVSGLTKYRDIDVKEHHNDSKTRGLGYIYGSFDNSMLTNEIHVYGEDYKPRTTIQMLATTFHELGHASHRAHAGGHNAYANAGLAIQETWANGVRYAYMSSLYPDIYTEVLDDFGYSESYTAIMESLMWQGVSLLQIQSALEGCTNMTAFRSAVKSSTSIPDTLVDYIFDNPTVRFRVNMNSSIGPLSGGQITYPYSSTPIDRGTVPPPFSGGAASGGSGTYVYQWEISTDAATWIPLAGATSTTYHYNSPIGQTTYFRRKVTSAGQTAYSNVVEVQIRSSRKPGKSTEQTKLI